MKDLITTIFRWPSEKKIAIEYSYKLDYQELELEVNEDDTEEIVLERGDELTTEELQEILNEEHQETQRNVSPSE
ncbi:hypothetical protein TNCV_1606731 [Trichonephila clavipes]|nr:hypothetical protein TNCV_1606731 [Trichonephila clavipes]